MGLPVDTLATIANYAEIIGAIAVIFAIAFGILEFRQLRYQRRENASLEMMRSWQSPEYVNAVFVIMQLEDHIQLDTLRGLSDEHERMAFRVSMTFEVMGLMAHRGTLPLDLIHDLMGGAVSSTWTKLDRWVIQFRDQYNPRAFEWYQWLAKEIASRPAPTFEGSGD